MNTNDIDFKILDELLDKNTSLDKIHALTNLSKRDIIIYEFDTWKWKSIDNLEKWCSANSKIIYYECGMIKTLSKKEYLNYQEALGIIEKSNNKVKKK